MSPRKNTQTPSKKELKVKVYIASHFSRKNEVRMAAQELRALDIDVVSTWHRETTKSNSIMHKGNARTWRKYALSDLNELCGCTHFVLFSMGATKKFSRGSHCWEAGFASGQGKKCIVVGERQVIFHYLPGERICKTWASAKRYLKKEFQNEPNTATIGQYADYVYFNPFGNINLTI